MCSVRAQTRNYRFKRGATRKEYTGEGTPGDFDGGEITDSQVKGACISLLLRLKLLPHIPTNLVALKKQINFLTVLEVRSLRMGPQGRIPSECSREESVFLPFLAFRGHLHSLAHGPPSFSKPTAYLPISVFVPLLPLLHCFLFYKDPCDHIESILIIQENFSNSST